MPGKIRNARDEQLSIEHRFGGLRSAVQRFSPNGFTDTFANLQQAVGVTDPSKWTADQITQAADLLNESRAHHRRHRARWDEKRRTHKANGIRDPSSEELEAFDDRSWFDDISHSSRPRYLWGGLADWVRANDVAPLPVGSAMEDDLRKALGRMPSPQIEPKHSMLVHYGPYASSSKPANVIDIPYRTYNDPITDFAYRSLSDRQRLIADCWYTRSHDGHVRQRHLRRIIAAKEHWVVPYVLVALGDYVVEIVCEVELNLTPQLEPGSWHHHAYRMFAAHNHDFIELMRQRATSYQHVYHSASYARTSGAGDGPVYPAFPVLDLLGAASNYRSTYRLSGA